jgi:TonB family protein
MSPSAVFLLATLAAMPQNGPTPARNNCADALTRGINATGGEICLADDELKRANTLSQGSTERTRAIRAALEHYQRAHALATAAEDKTRALEGLAALYDTAYLNEPGPLEAVLRDLVNLAPEDLRRLFRLATVQEAHDNFDSAEITLQAARRRQPDSAEPYKALMQFFARRATAIAAAKGTQNAANSESASPGPSERQGAVRVGGGVKPPERLQFVPARMPPEAVAAGVQGVVILEVAISEEGLVSDVKVLRSIPLLDQAAIDSARQWRFAPTLLNGRPVPVMMTATVNFTR